jgi:Calx-beta domain
VTLSAAPLSTVTVDWATANGTALAGFDYLSASGTVTFPAGVSARTVNVSVLGNVVPELNKTFYVNLSNPSANAYLGDTQALGTIVNDD